MKPWSSLGWPADRPQLTITIRLANPSASQGPWLGFWGSLPPEGYQGEVARNTVYLHTTLLAQDRTISEPVHGPGPSWFPTPAWMDHTGRKGPQEEVTAGCTHGGNLWCIFSDLRFRNLFFRHLKKPHCIRMHTPRWRPKGRSHASAAPHSPIIHTTQHHR